MGARNSTPGRAGGTAGTARTFRGCLAVRNPHKGKEATPSEGTDASTAGSAKAKAVEREVVDFDPLLSNRSVAQGWEEEQEEDEEEEDPLNDRLQPKHRRKKAKERQRQPAHPLQNDAVMENEPALAVRRKEVMDGPKLAEDDSSDDDDGGRPKQVATMRRHEPVALLEEDDEETRRKTRMERLRRENEFHYRGDGNDKKDEPGSSNKGSNGVASSSKPSNAEIKNKMSKTTGKKVLWKDSSDNENDKQEREGDREREKQKEKEKEKAKKATTTTEKKNKNRIRKYVDPTISGMKAAGIRRRLPDVSSIPLPFPINKETNKIDFWAPTFQYDLLDILALQGDGDDKHSAEGSWHEGTIIDCKMDYQPSDRPGHGPHIDLSSVWFYIEYIFNPYGREDEARRQREREAYLQTYGVEAYAFYEFQYEWVHLGTESHRIAPLHTFTDAPLPEIRSVDFRGKNGKRGEVEKNGNKSGSTASSKSQTVVTNSYSRLFGDDDENDSKLFSSSSSASKRDGRSNERSRPLVGKSEKVKIQDDDEELFQVKNHVERISDVRKAKLEALKKEAEAQQLEDEKAKRAEREKVSAEEEKARKKREEKEAKRKAKKKKKETEKSFKDIKSERERREREDEENKLLAKMREMDEAKAQIESRLLSLYGSKESNRGKKEQNAVAKMSSSDEERRKEDRRERKKKSKKKEERKKRSKKTDEEKKKKSKKKEKENRKAQQVDKGPLADESDPEETAVLVNEAAADLGFTPMKPCTVTEVRSFFGSVWGGGGGGEGWRGAEGQ